MPHWQSAVAHPGLWSRARDQQALPASFRSIKPAFHLARLHGIIGLVGHNSPIKPSARTEKIQKALPLPEVTQDLTGGSLHVA